MRMLMVGLHLEQVNHIYQRGFLIPEAHPQDGNGNHGLQGRGIAAACHNHIRLLAAVIACPLPDTNALGAVFHSLIHGQPLHARMLGSHDDIDVVLALNTMVEAGKQAVGIRREDTCGQHLLSCWQYGLKPGS